ncbi:MAG: glucosidase, partial [Hymenobacter sp.]
MTESERLEQHYAQAENWLQWGPYLSERQWGTVREDYSEGGEAWSYLSHEDAAARAYRWGEDGLAAISDDTQTLCFALTLWNGQDDRLKERLFGLTNGEGNHGEDVKELYYYLDNTPTHSYQRFLYKYPQAAFPYQQLRETNANRKPTDPEFELLDTGILDDNRYFDVVTEYAKASPTDLLVRLTVSNRGPEAAPLHLLPTLWFRNRWSFGVESGKPAITRQQPTASYHAVQAHHNRLGDYTLYFPATDTVLLTDNETNNERIFDTPNETGALVKDAFHAALLPGGEANHPSRSAAVGTKAAPVYQLTIGPGETVEVRLRLSTDGSLAEPLGDDFTIVFNTRLREADAFYQPLLAGSSPELAAVKRQAWAGVLWSKQYYNYDVARWLAGDPSQPTPPAGRGEVRNGDWPNFKAEHIILMPDKWEYPWFAAWDLVFHCLALAPIDLMLAKQQCLLLATTPHFAKPDGWIPSYEFDFSNNNPPVQGQSAWLLYEYGKDVLGQADTAFLREALTAFLPNHNWWMERFHRHPEESFKGSFLGLDNASLLNREEVPGGGYLQQVDSLSWLAGYTLYLMRAALELAPEDADYEQLAIKLFRDFEEVGGSLAELAAVWKDDPELNKTGFHYDILVEPDGQRRPVAMR